MRLALRPATTRRRREPSTRRSAPPTTSPPVFAASYIRTLERAPGNGSRRPSRRWPTPPTVTASSSTASPARTARASSRRCCSASAGVPDELVAADYAASGPGVERALGAWFATARRRRPSCALRRRVVASRPTPTMARRARLAARDRRRCRTTYLRDGRRSRTISSSGCARRLVESPVSRSAAPPARPRARPRRRRARGARARRRAARARRRRRACSSARASSQSASAGLRGRSGPWRYVPIAAADPAALEAGGAVVPVTRERRVRAASRRRRAACGRRGSRSPATVVDDAVPRSTSSRTSPISRRSPATVSSGKTPAPGIQEPSRPR